MAVWAKQKPSEARRLEEIVGVVGAYGFDVTFHRGRFWRRKTNGRARKLTPPERLRLLLEELGPTYMKLGQAISTRPDLVPKDFALELQKLQDAAPPVPFEKIAPIVEGELGMTLDHAFLRFEEEPRASASVSQVHNAVLLDGTPVVVKVRRPGVEKQIAEDLLVMEDATKYISRYVEEARTQDLEGWFQEFEVSLQAQLDFRREAANVERFRHDLEDDPDVFIPKVYPDYSTERILTLDRVDGMKVTDSKAIRDAGVDPSEVARICAHVTLKTIHEFGFFHADPHAGNFFVLPDGRVAIIDMGMVGHLDRRLNDTLLRLSLMVAQADPTRLSDEIIAFADSDEPINQNSLRRDIRRLLDRHFGGYEPVSFATMLFDLIRVSSQHGLRMPSSIALLARTYVMAEGIGKALDPCFSFKDYAEPFLKKLFVKRYSPMGLAEQMKEDAPMLAHIATSLPARADRLLIQLEKGQLSFVARVQELDRILHHIHLAAHRISMSMLAAGIIGGLSILTLVFRPQGFYGWPGVLLAILIVAIVSVSISLLLTIWRSWRDT